MKGSFQTGMRGLAIGLALSLSGCATIGEQLNPFAEPPAKEALLGSANDHALSGGGSGGKGDAARAAWEAAATYQRAHYPSPNNPVVKPSVIRLMWIPDHVNTHGDLVPEHYYYLKVKSDDWAVQDAFELEAQLNRSNGDTSNIPYITDER